MCSGGREHGLKLRRDLGTRWKVKFSSALLGSLAGPEHETAIRHINRRKANTLHIHGNSQKKMKIQRNVKTEMRLYQVERRKAIVEK